jgi:hypothetical protein
VFGEIPWIAAFEVGDFEYLERFCMGRFVLGVELLK